MKTSRRSFLNNSSRFVLGACVLPFHALAKNDKSSYSQPKINVGAHPWIYAAKLENYDITPMLETIFQDIKYAGMDGVELMEHPLRNYDATLQIKDLISKYDLPVIGTSYGADMWDERKHVQIIDDVYTITNNLESLNGKTFGISCGHTPEPKTIDQLDSQAELIKVLIGICEQRNIVLNLHNHTYELENDMHDLKGTIHRIPEIKLGPDINWLIRGGVKPVKFINTYHDRIVFLHLRDQNKDGTWSESMGEGITDYKSIGKDLKKYNFSGTLVIELAHENDFIPTRPIRESLKMSRDYVKNAMGF